MNLRSDIIPTDEHPSLSAAQTRAGVGDAIRFHGNLDLLAGLHVSIGGSREASPSALTAIEALAGNLAERGVVVVSGGALGTDTAAHRGALQVGGRTIVVLPCAIEDIVLDRWRPSLARLWDFDRVLFLSPFAPRHRPSRSSPIVRNRLMAGMAMLSVGGQTGISGGTIHFLRSSLELRVPCFLLEPDAPDAELKMALGALRMRGATTFSEREALDPAFAERLVRAAREEAARRARDDDAQLRLCEEPAAYGFDEDP